MSAESIVAISAAVTALVQLTKWAGLRDQWGPVIVILFSGIGVAIWLASQPAWPPVRTDIWAIFAGWISVALSSAGIFGFTRAGAGAVTRATSPPADGAGSSATMPPLVDGARASAEEIADVLERRRLARIQERLQQRQQEAAH
jgi:hypothetical protein